MTAALTGGVYFVALVATIALTRFSGGVACLWVAGAVLIAGLVVSPRWCWPGILLVCGLGSMIATATVGVGLAAALPLAVINLFESLVAAVLLGRFGGKRDPLDSLGQLAGLVLAVGILAPAAAAPLGAGVVAAVTGTPFVDNLVLWFTGHGLGNITAVPIFGFIASGAAYRWAVAASRERLLEGIGLLTLVLAVSAAVFSQDTLPILFLPVLPAILAAFRLGRLGGAASVIIIAAVGGWLTATGSGPVNLIDANAAARAQFLLFYLAATVLTVLPVAAELRHRRRLFDRLRESEARYRLLADHSTDIVLNLAVDGTIRYASPSIAQLGGYTPAAVIGRNALELVLLDDRDAVTRAHRAALADPDRTVIVEYRAATAAGEERWFETHTRGVRDEAGAVAGVVSAIRDIGHRKAIEGELSRVAATDPLTGLPNRRAFDEALDRLLAREGAAGCVAVVDLDHFKRVNDRHGHETGDRVLVAFAEVARGALREGDLVARLGGEEFGVLLPGADIAHAHLVCERIRRVVAGMRVTADGAEIGVTASVGLATLTTGELRADMLRAADAALYRAKAEGRDRLRLAA